MAKIDRNTTLRPAIHEFSSFDGRGKLEQDIDNQLILWEGLGKDTDH